MLYLLLKTPTNSAETSALIVNMDADLFWGSKTKKKICWKHWAPMIHPMLSLRRVIANERPLLVEMNE